MKKHTVMVLAGMLMWNALAAGVGAQNRHNVPTLDEAATAALITALSGENGEYALHAQYHAIIVAFGEIKPFTRLVEAEQRHIDALKKQCTKFGVPVPVDTYLDNVEVPDTLLEAALLAAEAEEMNAALYESLLADVVAYPSLTQVFETLETASTVNHLPAVLKLISHLE